MSISVKNIAVVQSSFPDGYDDKSKAVAQALLEAIEVIERQNKAMKRAASTEYVGGDEYHESIEQGDCFLKTIRGKG